MIYDTALKKIRSYESFTVATDPYFTAPYFFIVQAPDFKGQLTIFTLIFVIIYFLTSMQLNLRMDQIS